MSRDFARRIAPHVERELEEARLARSAGQPVSEFHHLERAHVLGQSSTYWHTKVHVLMCMWAVRNGSLREALGQVVRIVGAATKTALGLVPDGNTGGTNVSPFERLPIEPDLRRHIESARSGAGRSL